MLGVSVGVLVGGLGVAHAQDKAPINIAPQPLESALYDFGGQTGRQILFAPGLTNTKRTPGVTGEADAQVALAALLQGTGLTFRRDGDMFVIIQAGEGGGGPQSDSADRGGAEVDALIVTAQKKEEAIQDVPIAISAFTQKSLDAQKLEGGFDLLKAIPNVSFSKSNFSGYNFSIRGIGTKAVSATTDPGVAVSFNNSTLIVNRLFEQEYFDVERVEVLRGPQGTLYGRNATGGVINVISARPRLGEFEGDIKLETGNYNAMRARGMINVPVGDTLAIRLAGALTKRDGYGINEAASDPNVLNDVREDVDGRDLWSARLTVGWEPIEAVRVNALWERFEEDDNRVRTSKQLCKHDPGPNDYDTFDWDTSSLNPIIRPRTSQGCLPTSLYDEAAFGTPNGTSLPYVNALVQAIQIGVSGGFFGTTPTYGLGGNPYFLDPSSAPCPAAAEPGLFWVYPLDVCAPDPYGGRMQSRDLRTIHSALEPTYRAKADIFELSVDIDVSDSLTLTSQTVYSTDEYYASQDYNRYATFPIFADSSQACDILLKYGQFNGVDCSSRGTYADGFYNVTPGGVYTDPQLGPSRSLMARDLSQVSSEQFNQEFRLSSNFDAPWNFSLGANFTHFETMNDYYVFINALSLVTNFFPFNTDPDSGKYCAIPADLPQRSTPCVYVDPNPLESINGDGHNYFRSANPYKLTSSALFGELYWQVTETLKVTLGARMSWDQKIFTPVPSQLLLYDYRSSMEPGAGPEDCLTRDPCQLLGTGVNSGEGARGFMALPDIVQEWREPTGRLIVDWKPDLGVTDETMVYASLAHGYKGGGANPPNIAPPAGIFNAINSGGVNPATFEPEYVDALELGTKNTLLGGALILNGSAFYYDYEGYQVSKIVDRSALNENFDTTVWGLELEWIFSPTRNLRFNGTFGHLRTKIAEGEQSIDLMDRTQGGNISYTGSLGRTFDQWMVLKPWIVSTSNCVAPTELVGLMLAGGRGDLEVLCPGGNLAGNSAAAGGGFGVPGFGTYDPAKESPNGGAGFFADLSGHDLPNAPHWTASLGAQYRLALPGGWDGTIRGDFYWQDESFARAYNTEYDRLEAWTNANFSLWVEQPDWGVTAEVYVKNAFDETPITDAFLNSDDSGLTTNVFTLDPRLIGVSVRKSF
jgi:iron complex outermembrane receptor protein